MAEGVGVEWDEAHQKGNPLGVQVIRHRLKQLGWIGRIDVLDAHQRSMTLGMIAAEDVVQHVGKNHVAIFLADETEGRVGHIPEIARAHDIRETIGRPLLTGPGHDLGEGRIDNGGAAQFRIERVLAKALALVAHQAVTRLVEVIEAEPVLGLEKGRSPAADLPQVIFEPTDRSGRGQRLLLQGR